MEISIIRHTPVFNPHNLCYGQSDISLPDTFNSDVQKIKTKLLDHYDKVYSSPSIRCTKLCDALELPYTNDKRLMELNFGDWELRPWDEINRIEIDQWAEDVVKFKPGGIENLRMMYERVREFMDEISCSHHKKILIVTHSGVIRCIWSYLLQIPLENILKIPVHYHELLKFNHHINFNKRYIIQKE